MGRRGAIAAGEEALLAEERVATVARADADDRRWKTGIFKLPQLTPLSSEPYGHQSLSSIHQTKPDTSNL